MPRRAIDEVLQDHDGRLLSIPGVVGVCVGLGADPRTRCLKVMVVKRTRALEQQLPKSIEGYAVRIEETGLIRPLGGRAPKRTR